jgi:hypothetical protein
VPLCFNAREKRWTELEFDFLTSRRKRVIDWDVGGKD